MDELFNHGMKYLFENFWATMTMVFALAMTFIGLPTQIRKNKKAGEYGMSTSMTFIPFLLYISRIVYGIQLKSFFSGRTRHCRLDILGCTDWTVFQIQR